jgi:hypothetical protein
MKSLKFFTHSSISLSRAMSAIAKLRSVHVADMAVFDWVATLLGAIVLAKMMGTSHVAGVFVALVIVAIIAHKAFDVPTRLNSYLGLAKKEDVYAVRERANQTVSS